MFWPVLIVAATLLIFVILRLSFKGRNPMWKGKGSKASARGKTIVVTGANSGIGKALVQELSMRGADHLVLACRNWQRASNARDELIKAGAEESRISIEIIDLMSMKSVVNCVEQLKKKHPIIDVLVCNAGVIQADGDTEDGVEKLLQANYMGHFLLVESLRAKIDLRRVVFVSSLVHKYARHEDLTAVVDNGMMYMKRYSRAKLAEVAYARYLVDGGMQAFSCNPGVVHTNILAGTWMEIFSTYMDPVLAFIMKSALEGAQTPLMLSLAPSDALKLGAYYSDCAEDRTHSLLKDDVKIQRMYEQSKEMCREHL